MVENRTVFYTEKFGKLLNECNQLIWLNIGDKFTYEGEMYEITFKLFHTTDEIMVYHGKLC